LRVLNVETIAHSLSSPSGPSGTESRAASARYTASVGVWKFTRSRSSPSVRKVCR
jgi:hypothetical protein